MAGAAIGRTTSVMAAAMFTPERLANLRTDEARAALVDPSRMLGRYNLVISTNRCERNHGYVNSRVRPMRGLKRFKCAMRLFPSLDALQLVERGFVRVPPIGAPCTGVRSYVRARHIAAIITRLGRTS